MRTRLRAAALVAVAALALTGCQAEVVPLVDPPNWGNADSGETVAPGTIPMADVLVAAAPSMCGIAEGQLVEGVLAASSTAAPLAPKDGDAATAARIAYDEQTGRPLVTTATRPDAVVGAAAVFDCDFPDRTTQDRVVLWDTALQPIGVISISGLRGSEQAHATGVRLDGDGVVVTFVPAGADFAPKPGAKPAELGLTVEDGVLTVGSIVEA